MFAFLSPASPLSTSAFASDSWRRRVLDLGPNSPTQDGQARTRLIRLDQRGGRAFLAVPKVVVRLLLDPALALWLGERLARVAGGVAEERLRFEIIVQ